MCKGWHLDAKNEEVFSDLGFVLVDIKTFNFFGSYVSMYFIDIFDDFFFFFFLLNTMLIHM